MKPILAIDVGNTFIKCALFAGSELKQSWSCETGKAASAVAEILEHNNVDVALSSVVPAATQVIKDTLANAGSSLYVVSPLTQTIIAEMNPEMGADRVAAAVAAWKIYGNGERGAIVMSFGTATTLLCISAHGKMGGGFIAPGIGLMFDALHKRCALLPLENLDGAELAPGYDTISHMKNGVLSGHMGMVKEWLHLAKASLAGDCVTVATGGWDTALEKHGQIFDHVDQDLTLKGINILAREHAQTNE